MAWAICISFAVNFVQCYHALFCLTLRMKWGPFWKSFLSPLLLTVILSLALTGIAWLLPEGTPLLPSLAAKCAAAGLLWLAYIQLGGVYNLKELAARLRPGK